MLDQTSSLNRDSLAVTGETHCDSAPQRRPFTEPKLQFIEPKLTKRGDLTQVTGENDDFFTPVP